MRRTRGRLRALTTVTLGWLAVACSPSEDLETRTANVSEPLKAKIDGGADAATDARAHPAVDAGADAAVDAAADATTDAFPDASSGASDAALCTPAVICGLLDCGIYPDGCGGTLDCGSCGVGTTCVYQPPGCNEFEGICLTPATAKCESCLTQEQACSTVQCGMVWSCSGWVDCTPPLLAGEVCNSGQVVCTRGPSCPSLSCGTNLDACGRIVDCGTCNMGEVCSNGECVADCSTISCPKDMICISGDCVPRDVY